MLRTILGSERRVPSIDRLRCREGTARFVDRGEYDFPWRGIGRGRIGTIAIGVRMDSRVGELSTDHDLVIMSESLLISSRAASIGRLCVLLAGLVAALSAALAFLIPVEWSCFEVL